MKLRNCYAVLLVIAMVITTGCLPPPPKEVPLPRKQAKVAVVLGAGASKGFAHIGVLKILEANRVPIHMVVGTSVGSFIGSLYAYGLNAYQLQQLSMGIEKGDIVDITIPDNGFIKGERLAGYVNRILRDTPIEKLKIPFYAVATDITRGEEVVFGTGNTGTAVRASCSVPGIFQPVRIASGTYVDGGVVSPVAVQAARKYGADLVIAVDISSPMQGSSPTGTMETILQSVDVMYSRIAANQISGADVIIRPNIRNIGSSDFSKRHEAILEGEKAALQALPAILEKIAQLKAAGRL